MALSISQVADKYSRYKLQYGNMSEFRNFGTVTCLNYEILLSHLFQQIHYLQPSAETNQTIISHLTMTDCFIQLHKCAQQNILKKIMRVTPETP